MAETLPATMEERVDKLVELGILVVLDDVSCSLSTIRFNDRMIDTLVSNMPTEAVQLATDRINAILSKESVYCSGSPYRHTDVAFLCQ